MNRPNIPPMVRTLKGEMIKKAGAEKGSTPPTAGKNRYRKTPVETEYDNKISNSRATITQVIALTQRRGRRSHFCQGGWGDKKLI